MDMGIHVEKHEAQKEHINKHKIAHMIGVAEYMRNNAPKYNLHPEAMYTLGLLHDIGYLYGRHQHESLGAEMLICNVGINDEIYFAIKQHGRCVNDMLFLSLMLFNMFPHIHLPFSSFYLLYNMY
jgi:putative nucleotidyltransferase with HDIG domain